MASSRLERLQLILGLTDRLSEPLQRIQRLVNRVTNNISQGFQNARDGIGAMFAAGAGFAMTVSPTIDMNNARGEVASLGVDDAVLDQLNQSGLQYSMQFGESAQGYVRAAYDIQSAIDGLQGADLPTFTTAAGTLAKATKADVGTVTSYFGSMYGIFRRQATEMGKSNWVEMVTGRTAVAVQKFKTSGPQMAAAFESLGADATSYGVSMAEQMAILGNLQSALPSGSEAGSKYRAYLAGVVNAESKLGLKFSDSEGRLLPVVDVLERIRNKYGDIDTLAEGGLLNTAFGGTEATAFLKLLSADIGKINKDIKEIADIKGANKAIEMAQKMEDPWARLSMAITAVTIAIYQKALPAIEPFIRQMVDGMAVLVAWTDKYPHLTKVVGLLSFALLGLVAVGGAVSLTVGIMRFALGGLQATLIPAIAMIWRYGFSWIFAIRNINLAGRAMALFNFIGRAVIVSFAAVKAITLGLAGGFGLLAGGLWSAITATWSFTAALLANPITWIVLGIVALIAGLVALVFYWDEVTAGIKRFADFVATGAVNAWQSFIDFIGSINPFDFVGESIDWLITKINLIPGIDIDLNNPDIPQLPNQVQTVQQQIQPAGEKTSWFSGLGGNITEGVSTGIDAAINWFNSEPEIPALPDAVATANIVPKMGAVPAITDQSAIAKITPEMSNVPAIQPGITTASIVPVLGPEPQLPALENTANIQQILGAAPQLQTINQIARITSNMSDVPVISDQMAIANITPVLGQMPHLQEIRSTAQITPNMNDVPVIADQMTTAAINPILGTVPQLQEINQVARITPDLAPLPTVMDQSATAAISPMMGDVPVITDQMATANINPILGTVPAVSDSMATATIDTVLNSVPELQEMNQIARITPEMSPIPMVANQMATANIEAVLSPVPELQEIQSAARITPELFPVPTVSDQSAIAAISPMMGDIPTVADTLATANINPVLGTVPQLPQITNTADLIPALGTMPELPEITAIARITPEIGDIPGLETDSSILQQQQLEMQLQQESEQLKPEALQLQPQPQKMEQGGLLQAISNVVNNNNQGGNTVHIEKLEVVNQGEAMTGDQLLYELKMATS